MARLPNWRDQQAQEYIKAPENWGSGINPIHAQRQGNESRNLTQGTYNPAPTGLISGEWDYGIEDYAPGMDTRYMDVRPNWGDPGGRMVAGGHLPPWGPGKYGGPEGYDKRGMPEGVSPREGHVNQVPRGKAGEGWRNKLTSFINNAGDSEPNQLLIRTSWRQRDLAKNNELAVSRGTDKPREQIPSRITPMRLKVYSGGIRHYDMEPRQHTNMMRPWRYRGVGTGPIEWMEPNAYQQVSPITREIPPDVYQGLPETSIENYDSESDGWWY